MSELTGATHVLNSTTMAAAGITVAGIATGVNIDILFAGFAGSLVSLSFLGELSIAKRCWTLFTSTLTAGFTAPTLSAWVAKMVENSDSPPSGVFAGFVIGVTAQVFIPGIMKLVKSRLAKYEAKPEN